MNILFLTASIPAATSGGVEAVTLKLQAIFRNAGHNVFGIAKYPTEGVELDNFYTLPEPVWADREKNLSFASRVCEENKIDIIINNGCSHDLLLLARFLRSEKIRVISCFHNDPDTVKAQLLDHFSGILHDHTKKGYLLRCLKELIKFPFNYYYNKKWMQKKYWEMYHYSDACVLLSDHFKKKFADIGKLSDTEKLTSIGNPVHIVYDKKQSETTENKKVVLWLGRMVYLQKRPDRMLKIWEIVHAENQDWELWMCGDGAAKESLEKRCKKRNIKNVRFLGNVKSEEIYPQVSVFCMTSSYEGFPMVIAETLSQHIPIIAFSSFAPLSELCIDCKNAIFIPPFSIKRFACSLDELMKSSDNRNSMANYDQSYLDKFSPDHVRKQWEALFERLKEK